MPVSLEVRLHRAPETIAQQDPPSRHNGVVARGNGVGGRGRSVEGMPSTSKCCWEYETGNSTRRDKEISDMQM